MKDLNFDEPDYRILNEALEEYPELFSNEDLEEYPIDHILPLLPSDHRRINE